MKYTIKAVNPQARSYETKFGSMVSYKVMFENFETVVEISQKASSPAPKVGDTVEGTIDMSAPYGPKFKKEYNQGGFGSPTGQSTQGRSAGSTSGSSKFEKDPFTMYLSYAKDVAVALIASKEGFVEEKFASILESVLVGGETLYNNRPGVKEPETVKDNVATDAEVDNFLPEDIAKIFDKDEPVVEVSWPEEN